MERGDAISTMRKSTSRKLPASLTLLRTSPVPNPSPTADDPTNPNDGAHEVSFGDSPASHLTLAEGEGKFSTSETVQFAREMSWTGR